MKAIKLTNSDEPCLVDDEDFPLLNELSWYLGERPYAYTKFYVGGNQKHGLMHRIILNAPKGLIVDHIDGNKLNNQKLNLRLCTAFQNEQHRVSLNKNNTSGAIGVHRHKKSGLWKAEIVAFGKSIAKYAKTFEVAVELRRKMQAELHGEFQASV